MGQFRRRRHNGHLRQRGRGVSGTQAFGGRRSGIGLEGEQIGDGGIGVRQIQLGRVHDLLGRLVAAGDADGLSAVVGLRSAGASGLASLRAAAVLGLRQFVSGIIDDVGLGMRGGSGSSMVKNRPGSTTMARNRRHSSSQAASMPR